MAWVAAKPIVALVTDEQSVGHRAVGYFPRYPVRAFREAADIDFAIAALICDACPIPALF